MFRAALDALRAASEPMTVRQILQSGLRASLEGHAGKTVERVSPRKPGEDKMTQCNNPTPRTSQLLKPRRVALLASIAGAH
jgi:hypothetical protein